MPARSPATDARDAALRAFASARLGHDFADLGLLREALTHGSARTAGRNYQRLEFLGDRVLGCIIATWLFNEHDEAEGRLSSRLHALVEGSANAEVARGWDVADLIEMEPQTKLKGLNRSDNVLGDVAEAIIAAIYLDAGWDAAVAFVRREWARLLVKGPRLLEDPKAMLQHWAEKHRRGMPRYVVVDRQGPDHAPVFTIEAAVTGLEPALASGGSKLEAEKAAAAALCSQLPAQPERRTRR